MRIVVGGERIQQEMRKGKWLMNFFLYFSHRFTFMRAIVCSLKI